MADYLVQTIFSEPINTMGNQRLPTTVEPLAPLELLEPISAPLDGVYGLVRTSGHASGWACAGQHHGFLDLYTLEQILLIREGGRLVLQERFKQSPGER